ncbi:zinc ribbon domain-containing protein [Methanobacterium spitsbergense]|uniref:Zinc ribbon domain-containing protein n=1 Tax=Methanobacterium spitsbergense TaxID=2874285 RepID=A0A8T5UQF8_9EURY|nr:zinc ribbon domain-containing protein [Methanobacterium spitsbergense]MBZ2165904.1 zinc ribbon domain-containing protein [Methanobacterium spitsbergense]
MVNKRLDRSISQDEDISCPRCSVLNNPNSKFCRECGKPLVESSPTTNDVDISCPRCSVLNNPNSKFCTECGKPLVESSPIKEDKLNERIKGDEDPIGSLIQSWERLVGKRRVSMKSKCPECSAPIHQDSKFCRKCGATIPSTSLSEK